MPEIAKKVTLDHIQRKLFIDGVEFPHHIVAEDGVIFRSASDTGDLSTVTITFFTEAAEVIPRDAEG